MSVQGLLYATVAPASLGAKAGREGNAMPSSP